MMRNYKFIVSTRSSISGTELNVISDVELNGWSLRFEIKFHVIQTGILKEGASVL